MTQSGKWITGELHTQKIPTVKAPEQIRPGAQESLRTGQADDHSS
jgi:hypothetical protein